MAITLSAVLATESHLYSISSKEYILRFLKGPSRFQMNFFLLSHFVQRQPPLLLNDCREEWSIWL